MIKDNKKLKDEEILEMSLSNPKYFELIVDRYQKVFLKRSISVAKSKEEAEDIVQDTFLKIYKYASRFEEIPGASFKSWAYEILRNTTYSHYKKTKKRLLHVRTFDLSEYDIEDKSVSVVEEIETKDRISLVKSILGLMPKSFSDILRLRFIEHRSQKEIAKIENISKEAVRVRLHRAKNLFKNLIANNT